MSRPYVPPVVAALFVTFLWSTSWVLIKIGLSDDLPPLTFAGLRYAIAAMVLFGVLAASPRARTELRTTTSAQRWLFVALGVVMYGLTQGAQFIGLSLLAAATLSLLLSFTPALVTVAGRAIGEGATGRQWAGIGLALAGAAVYLGPELGATSTAGLLVGLFGLVANAVASVLGRHVNSTVSVSAVVVTAPSMAVGAALTLGAGLSLDRLPVLHTTEWLIVVWLAVVNTALAFTIWNHTLRHLTATESSAINNTMLVQIAVLAWIFVDEDLSALQWASLALVSVGIYLVQRRRTTKS